MLYTCICPVVSNFLLHPLVLFSGINKINILKNISGKKSIDVGNHTTSLCFVKA